jgi:hypothetical protein
MPYKYNALTGELDLVLGPGTGTSVVEFQTDSGVALPNGSGVINLLGGGALQTSASGNTINVSLITPLSVPQGGTGQTSFIPDSLIYGNGFNALQNLGAATNGQIPIGNTGAPPILALPISSNGSVIITPGAGSLDFEVSGGQAATNIEVDIASGSGTDPVLPTSAGTITVTGAQVAASTIGANVVRTHSTAANSYTIEIQRSTTSGSADSANNGVCHFSSVDFTVDANGFVELTGADNFAWTEVVGTSQAMAVNNGYIASNAGLVTLTLPGTAALGQIIRVAGKGSGGWQIAQNGGQTIHFGAANTTTGAGGSLASTNRYDSIELLCITADTDFVVLSSIGNITVV